MVSIFAPQKHRMEKLKVFNDNKVKEFDEALHTVLLNLSKKGSCRWRGCSVNL